MKKLGSLSALGQQLGLLAVARFFHELLVEEREYVRYMLEKLLLLMLVFYITDVLHTSQSNVSRCETFLTSPPIPHQFPSLRNRGITASTHNGSKLPDHHQPSSHFASFASHDITNDQFSASRPRHRCTATSPHLW